MTVKIEDTFLDPDSFVVCKVCGARKSQLTFHLKKLHNMSIDEYKTTFNCSVEGYVCKNIRKKLSDSSKGEKNAGYNHGGKLSPYSKNFVKYKDLTDTEKQEKIMMLKEQTSQTKDTNHSVTTRLDYYTSRGFTTKEAEKQLKERQTTFTLEKCIERYGEEDGKTRWENRQAKWLASLDALPDDEKRRIRDLKFKGFQKSGAKSFSDISLKLFDLIHSYVPNIYYGKNEKSVRLENGDIIKPDCLYKEKKKIIEFYGDYWHCSPKRFLDESAYRNNNNSKTVKQVRDRDSEREENIKNSGYGLLIVWESDFIDDPEKVITQCTTFLTS